jgi:hypothetical protein
VYKTQNEDKHPFFITITNRQYRDTGNIVYKTQNEDKHPFFITITYRQYRDTGNIVYKTQNEDKHPFFITPSVFFNVCNCYFMFMFNILF